MNTQPSYRLVGSHAALQINLQIADDLATNELKHLGQHTLQSSRCSTKVLQKLLLHSQAEHNVVQHNGSARCGVKLNNAGYPLFRDLTQYNDVTSHHGMITRKSSKKTDRKMTKGSAEAQVTLQGSLEMCHLGRPSPIHNVGHSLQLPQALQNEN